MEDAEMKLVDLYRTHQLALEADLEKARLAHYHQATKGERSESAWLSMLRKHLPDRYRADRAFVIDANGAGSEQIDVVIYDRQYTPVLYDDEHKFLPAESIYAVFEVKQNLSKQHLEAAGQKVASVRRLRRTSATITHAGGSYKPRPPNPILGGILAYESTWSPPFGDAFDRHINQAKQDERLDLGCAARHGAFDIPPSSGGDVPTVHQSSSSSLVWFFLRLLSRLQGLGTVTAIEYDQYLRVLES